MNMTDRPTLEKDECPRFPGCEVFKDYCDHCKDRAGCKPENRPSSEAVDIEQKKRPPVLALRGW